jgi:hypothetical protein
MVLRFTRVIAAAAAVGAVAVDRRTIEVTIAGSGARAAGRLVHISCSSSEQQQQGQEQGQGQQPAAAGGSTGSNSSSSSSGSSDVQVLQLLQQWRESNALPAAKTAWRVQQGEGQGLNPGSNSSSTLNPGPGVPKGLVPAGDPKTWLVLGIESSCDDTAAAVIRGDGTVLSHRISSQVGGFGWY